MTTAALDWSQCPAVESTPGKRSGAWVFRGTRTPVSMVFENLQDMSVDELAQKFGVTRVFYSIRRSRVYERSFRRGSLAARANVIGNRLSSDAGFQMPTTRG